MSVDTLSLARELRAAEIEPSQAEAIAAAIGRAVVETAATNGDLNEMRSAIKADLVEVRSDLTDLRAATKSDLAELRLATKSDLSIVEGNLRTEIAKLDTRIEASTTRLVFWLVGTFIAVGSIVVAIIKLVPAQGF